MHPPETQLVEGLPKPPHWYQEFDSIVPDNDANNCPDDFINHISQEKLHQLCPPPPIPQGNILSFGVPMNMDEVIKQPPLDSDTKLFRDTPGGPDGQVPELRNEFARLLEMMLDDIGYLMGQCSQSGGSNIGSISSTSKKIIKVYKNLHYILTLLREFQFYEGLLNQLERQFNHRLAIINDIRAIAFDLEPLTMSDFEAPSVS
eukprot:Protomagalhaensia_sp_Gyna_25__4899@NODE_51_length_6078_cov_73_141911_g38_i0_p3_GENE_NODE_51_length_6078_cov_73_141911_g38_i0NODE_51_length_6078_cov_73_141911_g38_i0_p3_ORF_typecomplete_len203_score43_21Med7/PF05983_11/3_2e14TGS/PF02824_21/1_1TGS/PF02824_21/3_9e02_NODE_51_length_6078_cov_73_141911_g38_i042294837